MADGRAQLLDQAVAERREQFSRDARARAEQLLAKWKPRGDEARRSAVQVAVEAARAEAAKAVALIAERPIGTPWDRATSDQKAWLRSLAPGSDSPVAATVEAGAPKTSTSVATSESAAAPNVSAPDAASKPAPEVSEEQDEWPDFSQVVEMQIPKLTSTPHSLDHKYPVFAPMANPDTSQPGYPPPPPRQAALGNKPPPPPPGFAFGTMRDTNSREVCRVATSVTSCQQGLTPLPCSLAIWQDLAFWKALRTGDTETVERLVTQPRLALTGIANVKPLAEACWYGQLEVVKVLHAHGAAIDDKDSNGRQPIHYACFYKENLELVKWLVSKGADPNAKSKHLGTPLAYARLMDPPQTSVIEWLEAELGPDSEPVMPPDPKLVALYEAAQAEIDAKHEEKVKALRAAVDDDGIEGWLAQQKLGPPP